MLAVLSLVALSSVASCAFAEDHAVAAHEQAATHHKAAEAK